MTQPDADPSGRSGNHGQRPAQQPGPGSTPPPEVPGPPPQAETPEPAPTSEKRTERPHPLTPLIRGWVLLVALAIAFGREYLPVGTSRPQLPPIEFILATVTVVALGGGIAGFFSWYFTRFVIDHDELRVETGMVFRTSARIAFDRVQSIDVVQPFAARIFGLVELRILGGDGPTRLRYLGLTRAHALRDYLLGRARGVLVTVDAPAPISVLNDLTTADQVLVRVPPGRLVLAAVTSHEFLGLVAGGVAAGVAAMALEHPWLAFTLALSMIPALVGVATRQVTSQFNFTLSRRPTGLRISRGLTSLASQSVPNRRVQAVEVSQSPLWRGLGLFRIELGVIGGGAGGDEDEPSAGTTLLPAGTADQVRTAIAALWPNAHPEAITLHPVPTRARWLHPFAAPFLGWGFDDAFVATRHGWLVRRWQYVPHARVQSIGLVQGPLARRLGLVTCEFHTADPRLQVEAVGLDGHEALAALTSLSERAYPRHVPDVAEAAQPAARRADQAEATISSIE